MAHDQDTQPYMKNLRLMPSIFAAALAVMTEKGRTYGESWKARGGRGAWYTLVRPLDRLTKIVEEDHQGDIFAAVEAGASGGDGTALDALRDLRNYLTLVETEMVSRGVVRLPPVPEEDHMMMLKTSLQRLFGMGAPHHVERIVHSDTQQMTLALHFVPPHHSSIYDRQAACQETVLGSVMTMEQAERIARRVPDEVVERATDAARDRASAVEDTQDTETAGARLGTGPVADGCYTILDLGHGVGLWHVGLDAIPNTGQRTISRALADAAGGLRDGALAVQEAGGLVASRELQGSGDLQIIIRIPRG